MIDLLIIIFVIILFLCFNMECRNDSYNNDFEWHKKAADNGNAEAQFYVGEMYEYGRGVKRDYAKALEWYKKAADNGNIEAQSRLSEMYFYGR